MKKFGRLQEFAYALMPKHRGSMRCFHVAGIYAGSKLLSIGFNKDTTHPKLIEHKYWPDSGVHAELSAILREGREDFTGYTMAVLRIDRNDKINSSKPCPHCSRLIKTLNFKRIFYTNEKGEWIKQK